MWEKKKINLNLTDLIQSSVVANMNSKNINFYI